MQPSLQASLWAWQIPLTLSAELLGEQALHISTLCARCQMPTGLYSSMTAVTLQAVLAKVSLEVKL